MNEKDGKERLHKSLEGLKNAVYARNRERNGASAAPPGRENVIPFKKMTSAELRAFRHIQRHRLTDPEDPNL